MYGRGIRNETEHGKDRAKKEFTIACVKKEHYTSKDRCGHVIGELLVS